MKPFCLIIFIFGLSFVTAITLENGRENEEGTEAESEGGEGEGDEEEPEFNPEMISKCQKQENGSDEDTRSMKNWKKPKTRAEKCMYACMGEKLKFMQHGQKHGVIAKRIITYLEKHFGKSPLLELAKNAVNMCSSKSTGDRCDTAASMWECFAGFFKDAGTSMMNMFMPKAL